MRSSVAQNCASRLWIREFESSRPSQPVATIDNPERLLQKSRDDCVVRAGHQVSVFPFSGSPDEVARILRTQLEIFQNIGIGGGDRFDSPLSGRPKRSISKRRRPIISSVNKFRLPNRHRDDASAQAEKRFWANRALSLGSLYDGDAASGQGPSGRCLQTFGAGRL